MAVFNRKLPVKLLILVWNFTSHIRHCSSPSNNNSVSKIDRKEGRKKGRKKDGRKEGREEKNKFKIK